MIKHPICGAFLALVACSNGRGEPAFATAESPVPLEDTGNGKDGPLVATGTETFNTCHRILRVEDGSAVLEGWSGEAGARLLLWQVQGLQATAGDQEPIIEASALGSAGLWQLVRTVDVQPSATGGVLVISDPPAYPAYITDSAGQLAQACTIPEFTDVTVPAGVSLTATRWDPDRSPPDGPAAFLGFFASGILTVNGEIVANGAGFRGGLVVPPGSTSDELDAPWGEAGGKGEGIDAGSYTRAGYGNLANAGGGSPGCCGGGGGSNAGAGGFGGEHNVPTGDAYGMGGTAMFLGTFERLFLGGGGGAGHQDQNSAQPGARGGGLIMIFAEQLTGSGVIATNGLDGSYSSTDTSGGGGGGGTLWVQAPASTFRGTISAKGGVGGGASNNHPPGGGGGGGLILTNGFSLMEIHVDVSGGETGMSGSAPGTERGSTAGGTGRVLGP